MAQASAPIVQFYRLIHQARPPQRADRSAAGTLPTRAYRYCEAVGSASAFGWWVFPPSDVMLLWDGADVFWQPEGATDWLPLQPSVQFPHFADRFDRAAPEPMHGHSPPFLMALPEPGLLQIWTGLIARTAPGWSLLLRAPANLPAPGGFTLYEGIIESDRWFGPMFTNLRFTRSHTPIRLRHDFPLLQAQPVQRSAYSEEVLSSVTLNLDLAPLQQRDWDAYYTTIVAPNQNPNRPFGAYAVAARKRRKAACPFAMSAE